MKKIISAAGILMMLLSVSCNNGPKKALTPDQILDKAGDAKGLNTGHKSYTVDIPKDWTITDTVIHGVKFRFIFPPADVTGNRGGNMNILNESMQGVSLEKYMEATEKTMQNDMAGYKRVEGGDIEAGNIKGKWFHYYTVQNQKEIECIVYVFPSDDGVAYIMTGGTVKGKLDKYRNSFDAIAKSFRFVN